MRAIQIRQTLQAMDMPEPALEPKQIDLDEQGKVLELIGEHGKSIDTVGLWEPPLVIQYHQKQKLI